MKKKILMIAGAALCAVLLVVGSVVGTIAYLTSKVTVTNTFTVGNVAIDLNESLVRADGTVVPDADRVYHNDYHLVPGVKYTKDPRITIQANSEANYLFVSVVNGLAGVGLKDNEIDEASGKIRIATQMERNGWVPLEGYAGIYYFDSNSDKLVGSNAGVEAPNGIVAKSQATTYINVFETFTVSPTADLSQLQDTDGNGKVDPKIEITAYAVQATGFATPEAAWAATFATTNNGQ